MTTAPRKPCRHPGCGRAHRNANGYCAQHQANARDNQRALDRARAGSEHRKLYRTTEWQRLRMLQLQRKPLCEFCEKAQRAVPATVVDHIQPHHGAPALFFAPANLQSLCKRCHDSTKQRMEKAANK